MWKKKKKTVSTHNAPVAIGPYSQAVVAGGFVFCSGQIASHPGSGGLTPGGIDRQTKQVLDNLKAVLKAAGSSLDRVVKTTVYLKNMDDFAAMNEVYGQYFPADPPARAAFEVVRLPMDVLVEIECVAMV
jgi:2-iminobutanoate/2-iminopropanoate deaminase